MEVALAPSQVEPNINNPAKVAPIPSQTKPNIYNPAEVAPAPSQTELEEADEEESEVKVSTMKQGKP